MKIKNNIHFAVLCRKKKSADEWELCSGRGSSFKTWKKKSPHADNFKSMMEKRWTNHEYKIIKFVVKKI